MRLLDYCHKNNRNKMLDLISYCNKFLHLTCVISYSECLLKKKFDLLDKKITLEMLKGGILMQNYFTAIFASYRNSKVWNQYKYNCKYVCAHMYMEMEI